MDDIDGRHTQTILSAADKINESYIGSNKEQDKQRHCVSLPLYYDQVSFGFFLFSISIFSVFI